MRNEEKYYKKYPKTFNKDGSYYPDKLHLVSPRDLTNMYEEGSITNEDYFRLALAKGE